MKSTIHALAFFALMGSFAACSTAPDGKKVEITDAKTTATTPATTAAKTLNVDLAASKVEWLGTKTGGQHSGDMKLKSGSLQVEGGKLIGGSFVLDMTSIAVTDLNDKEKADLEGHLKTADFFEVEKHPEGKFEITAVKEAAGADGQTHLISGNLTLKGVTKGVNEFPAKVAISDAGVQASTPQFTIDRQVWGINYKSSMKDVVLNDNMGIKITLAAK
jgi:polyisoprenoid-binding protein YceI